MKLKHNIAYIAIVTLIAACAQSAQADIRSFFRNNGEDVMIGDSIKGKMITFNTEGELHTLSSDAHTLPQECRVVLEDDDTIWFENLFPMQTASNYRKWLKGSYIEDARYYDYSIKDYVTEDIIAIPWVRKIDFMEWVEGDKQFKCSLSLRNVVPGELPKISYNRPMINPDDEDMFLSSIRFRIGNDMSLTAVRAFGEVRAPFSTTYNYGVTNPYGINLDKLTYTETVGANGAEAYIANLKLIPKQL